MTAYVYRNVQTIVIRQMRIVTYATLLTSCFIKKSFTAIEGYLAHLNCYKNLSNSFCCSELFQEQTFILFSSLYHCLKNFSQWNEEVNFICSLIFER